MAMNQRERMRNRIGIKPEKSSAEKYSDHKDSRPVIDVRIDELLVHGIEVADRFYLADAVQGELTRILSEQGWPAHLQNTSTRDRLAGGAFSLEGISSGRMIGNQIAQAVYRGFSEVESSGLRSGPADPANNQTIAKR
jgi:hypothetical protein